MADFLANFSEAIAAIGIFIAGIVFTLIGTWLRSRRGNWVIVKRIAQTPLLRISDEIKDDLKIIYQGDEVEELVINTLEIFNSSDIEIEDFKINLRYSPEGERQSIFFRIFGVEDPENVTNVSPVLEKKEDKPNAVIWREYIKPIRKYPDIEKLTVTTISDSKLNFFVAGGDKNWHSRYVDETKPPILQKREVIFIVSGVLYLLLVVINSQLPSPNLAMAILVFVVGLFAAGFAIANILSLIQTAVHRLKEILQQR